MGSFLPFGVCIGSMFLVRKAFRESTTSVLIALLSSLLFSFLFSPELCSAWRRAWRVSRLDLHATLKDATRGTAGASTVWGRGNNLRRLLVISELALCVMLLIGAGLLIRSFVRLESVSPGFNPNHVLTLELTMSGPRYKDPQVVVATYRQLWNRLEALPGVTASGASHFAASESNVRLGTDYGRRARSSPRRKFHQCGSAHRQRPLLRSHGNSPAIRQVLQ